MTGEDKFFSYVGRVVCVCAVTFTLACAVFALQIVRDAYRDSAKPTFTLPPDSSALHRKAVK